MKPINADASDLINEAKKCLNDDSLFYQNRINSEDKTALEKMDEQLRNAKIIVHKDGKGATVLSSTGAIINIGEETLTKNFVDYKTQIEGTETFNETNKETEIALIEAVEALKNGSVTSKEKEKIELLDEVLKNVSIMVTDDNNEIVIADSSSKHYEIKGVTDLGTNQFSKKR